MRDAPFKDHVARYWRTTELGYPVERLEWRNRNGSSTYYANYMCYWGNLIVTGDLYEATYCIYGPEADLRFFSRCDASYLAGKLRGPSGYLDSDVWDSEKAEREIKQYVLVQTDVTSELRQKFLDDAQGSMSSEDEWQHFLDHHEHTKLIFGDCWYEYICLGKTRNPQIDFQLEGLKAAIKQLTDDKDPHFLDVKK